MTRRDQTGQNFSHQEKLFDPRTASPVVLLGAGSVGSWVALFLAKMGVPHITVWDADSVASHNLPMSAYEIGHIGMPKVIALSEKVERETGVQLTVHERMYEGEPLKNVSVISCVDTMEARRLIWSVVRGKASIPLFCDTRLDAAFIDILAITPTNREECKDYEALDFADSQANIQICGQHGIVYAATRAAGIVTASLTQYWMSGEKQWRVSERCDTLDRVL